MKATPQPPRRPATSGTSALKQRASGAVNVELTKKETAALARLNAEIKKAGRSWARMDFGKWEESQRRGIPKFEARIAAFNAAVAERQRAPVDSNVRKPLVGNAVLVYEHLLTLQEHLAMTGPAIVQWLEDKHAKFIGTDTLTKEILPQLRPYGLKNQPKIGYFIPFVDRPKK